MVKQRGQESEFNGLHDLRDYSSHSIKLQCPTFLLGLSVGFREVESKVYSYFFTDARMAFS
jgi:hypothetical protein